VVEHDLVVVVADLGFAAEFDRFPEPAFPDRAGVGVVQTDLTGRAPSGMVPAIHYRVWSTIWRVASNNSVRSSTARTSRHGADPRQRHSRPHA
jgi:hypothetical protein